MAGTHQSSDDASVEAQRLRRLREDLYEIGVRLPLASHFAKEILYALFPPVHERLVPNFGAFTLEPFGEEVDGVSWVQLRLPFPITDVRRMAQIWELGAARQLCDGYGTFLLCDSREIASLARPATELDLVDLQFAQGITTVQRTGDGKVKIFLPDFLAVHDRNTWTARPYSRRMAEPIRSAQRLDSTVGERLLDLAVHVLSPANVGATIVWLLDADTDDSPSFGTGHREKLGSLSVLEDGALSAMRSLCAQNDRAVVVNLDGEIVGYNVELVWKLDAAVTVEGGTRHNSAANASVVDHKAVFFVVSSDGPVSVFFAGRRIASYEAGSIQVECQHCAGTGATGPGSRCDDCAGTGRAWVERPMVDQPSSRPAARWGIPVHGLGRDATLGWGQPGEFIIEYQVDVDVDDAG